MGFELGIGSLNSNVSFVPFGFAARFCLPCSVKPKKNLFLFLVGRRASKLHILGFGVFSHISSLSFSSVSQKLFRNPQDKEAIFIPQETEKKKKKSLNFRPGDSFIEVLIFMTFK